MLASMFVEASENTGNVKMTEIKYLSAQELSGIADKKSGLPDDSGGMSLLFPKLISGKLYVMVFFYRSTIGSQHRIYSPHYVMTLNPISGEAFERRKIVPRDLGFDNEATILIFDEKIEAKKKDPANESWAEKYHRLLEISPHVWSIYQNGSPQNSAEVIREYKELFIRFSKAPLFPYYKALSPDFFNWLEEASR